MKRLSSTNTFKLSFRTVYCGTNRTVSCLHLRWLTCDAVCSFLAFVRLRCVPTRSEPVGARSIAAVWSWRTVHRVSPHTDVTAWPACTCPPTSRAITALGTMVWQRMPWVQTNHSQSWADPPTFQCRILCNCASCLAASVSTPASFVPT